MTGIQFNYCLRSGASGVTKHKVASAVTVIIVASCILLLTLLSALRRNVSYNMELLQKENMILAFVADNCSREKAELVTSKLVAIEGVASAKFVSNEDVYKDYIAENKSDYNISPAVFRSRFAIELKAGYKARDVIENVEALPEITETRSDDAVVEGFAGLKRIISTVLWFMTFLMATVVVIIVTNTIRLTMQTRRTEIQIESAMGAYDSFVVLPFVIEGLILGLLGSMLGFFPFLALYLVCNSLIVNSNFSQIISIVPLGNISYYMFWLSLLFGVVIGVLSSIIVVRNMLQQRGRTL